MNSLPNQQTRSAPSVLHSAAKPEVNRNPLIGNWQLTSLLGSGRWSHVFAARPRNARSDAPSDYAIKLLRDEVEQDTMAQEMLRREACAAKGVTSPHLATILNGQLQYAPLYLVMPRLHGATARTVLKEMGCFSIPQAIWIARQVAHALAALRNNGWLHGDIKPDNIMVSMSGHATLFDLGFAIHRDVRHTEDHALMGTLHYCAPERFTSRSAATSAGDVYSLGITLFELLTGYLPFPQTDASRLVEAHLTALPPSPRSYLPQLPRAVAQALQRMMAKDPLRRPTIGEELDTLLRRLELETFCMR
ncbi:MAG: serine/threonine-protein kinase [Pirellulaceae bacterium]|nr:serine/threonine protein kinase [Planctomycetales bacterium]